ncbi:MAG: hypothetical protein NC390_00035 [Fusobacterium sp.]|nr:hypothetical protein [Fusobacterium sp.]
MTKSYKAKIKKIENKILSIGLDMYRAKALSRILYSITAEPRAGIIQQYDDESMAYILYKHLEKIYNDLSNLERNLKI